jgi:hypothetical protein
LKVIKIFSSGTSKILALSKLHLFFKMKFSPMLLFCITPVIAFAPRMLRSLPATRMFATEEKKNTGHQAPGGAAQPVMSPEVWHVLFE